ncbi:MAG: hypothetical protein RR051_06970, partial [Clostridiales bacterium]
GLEGLKKDAILDIRASAALRGASYLLRPAAILAPLGIATNAYENSQEQNNRPPVSAETLTLGEQVFPGYKRHLSPTLYTGTTHSGGLGAGIVDGLIEVGAGLLNTAWGTAKYGYYAMMKGFSLQPMKDGPVKDYLTREGAKADGINAVAEDFGTELWNFFVEYQTNPLFRKTFQDQITGELKDYFTRLGGFTPDQGYAQGRLLVDIVTLLFTAGSLKKLMSSWKRLGTFRLKDYLPGKVPSKLPASPKTLPGKTPDIASMVNREAMDRLVNDPSGKLAANMTEDETREYLKNKRKGIIVQPGKQGPVLPDLMPKSGGEIKVKSVFVPAQTKQEAIRYAMEELGIKNYVTSQSKSTNNTLPLLNYVNESLLKYQNVFGYIMPPTIIFTDKNMGKSENEER